MTVLTDNWKSDVSVILIGTLIFIYLLLKRNYSYWNRMGFKTLPGVNCLLGHFKELAVQRQTFSYVMTKLYNSTNEPFIGFYGIIRPMLMIRDPQIIRSILIKDFTYFSNRGVHSNEEFDPLSANLFTLQGERWKFVRTKLTPTFTTGRLREMFSTLLDCGSTLQSYLDNLVEKGKQLDAREVSACFATNVISSIAFGPNVDSLSSPDNDFRVCGRKITERNFWNRFVAIAGFIQPKLLTWFRIKVVDKWTENFIMSVVKENVEYRERNNVSRKDLFQLLIKLRNGESVQQDDRWETDIKSEQDKTSFTLNEIAAQTFVFFAAGFETSSATLTFCLYELTKEPNIQQRIHDEIDEVLKKYDGQITYESISEMKYLEACVDETLRLYPFIPFVSRTCMKEYQIPGTNKIIPRGVDVVIPVISLQRDEKYYVDAKKFIPDRFHQDNPAGKDQLNQPFIPFGDGPRNCIGMRLGKMQTKVGLVLMLRKFRYELVDKERTKEIKYAPILHLSNIIKGLHFNVIRR